MAKRLKWGTIEWLKELVEQYFAEDKYPNIAGLCLKLEIHRDTWHYYTTEQWRYNRKEVEQEVKDKNAAELAESGAFEELMEISSNNVLGDDDNIENDALKQRVSDVLKKAQLRLENFNNQEIYKAKNPAGAIFVAKACFGYRETTPETKEQAQLPGKIIIEILQKPAQSQPIEAIPTTRYSVLPDAEGK